ILRADAADPDPRAVEVRYSLGMVHAARSDFLRSEELLKQTLASYEQTLGPDHARLVPVLLDLSRVYEAMGDLQAIGPVLERAHVINARTYGDGSPTHAVDLVRAANLARLKGDHEKAEAMARQALGIATRLLPDGHPGLVDFLGPLALVCQARKDYQ